MENDEKHKQISINFKKKFHHQSAATRTKGEKVTKIEEKKGIGRQWGKGEEGENKNYPFSFCVLRYFAEP